jgi:hypothetical protein
VTTDPVADADPDADADPVADASAERRPEPEPDPVVTAAAVAVLLVAAAFLGAAGAFLQLTASPWGLVLALAATAALSLGLAWLGYGRILRLAVAATWMLGAVSPALWRRGGDIVLPAGQMAARVYLYGGTALVLILLVVPARRRHSPATDGPPSGR